MYINWAGRGLGSGSSRPTPVLGREAWPRLASPLTQVEALEARAGAADWEEEEGGWLLGLTASSPLQERREDLLGPIWSPGDLIVSLEWLQAPRD